MVSSNPMILPMVLFTLMTPNSYPMGQKSHSLVTQNSQKLFKQGCYQTPGAKQLRCNQFSK